jgi:hypothetical protein
MYISGGVHTLHTYIHTLSENGKVRFRWTCHSSSPYVYVKIFLVLSFFAMENVAIKQSRRHRFHGNVFFSRQKNLNKGDKRMAKVLHRFQHISVLHNKKSFSSSKK